MNKLLLGALIALFAAGLGLFWWQGRAATEIGAPPPTVQEIDQIIAPEDNLPIVDPADMTGPSPPEATELTREEKRFFRYDRNRDRKITRNEMLSTRSDAFRKLDKDGNNLLTFEEWAVTTVTKFEGADRNRDQELTEAEFATTRPKPKKKAPRCRC